MGKKSLIVLLPLAAGFVLALGWLLADPNAPTYRSAQAADPIPSHRSYTHISWNFLADRPFEGGKMWISAWSGSNAPQCLLYDIERRQVLGHLINAHPAFFNRDQSAVLCLQRVSLVNTLRARIAALIERITGGGVRLKRPATAEIVWLLDLGRNSASRLGELSQEGGAGTQFVPSPDLRFAYNKPSPSFQKPEFLLCDLQKKSLATIVHDGWPQGWWDEQRILIKHPQEGFRLYDVIKGESSSLLSAAQIAAFLEGMKVAESSGSLNAFWIWNGRENDFYLTDTHKKWQATNSCLIKIERPDASLKLLGDDFKFEWSDHLDAAGRWYLYSGRERGQGCDGVFLRDVRNGAVRILVAPGEGKSHSIPRFYRDGVIYVRSNALWRVSLDGSNQSRVFPPP